MSLYKHEEEGGRGREDGEEEDEIEQMKEEGEVEEQMKQIMGS